MCIYEDEKPKTVRRRGKAKPKPTILRDTREKEIGNRWQWNKSTWCQGTEDYALLTGDYTIKEAPGLICIERKADHSEICNNFIPGKDSSRDRIYDEMERMMLEFRHRFIIVECELKDVLNKYNYRFLKKKQTRERAPSIIHGSLAAIQLKYDIHVIFAGDKGKECATKLLQKAWEYHLEREKRHGERSSSTG